MGKPKLRYNNNYPFIVRFFNAFELSPIDVRSGPIVNGTRLFRSWSISLIGEEGSVLNALASRACAGMSGTEFNPQKTNDLQAVYEIRHVTLKASLATDVGRRIGC